MRIIKSRNAFDSGLAVAAMVAKVKRDEVVKADDNPTAEADYMPDELAKMLRKVSGKKWPVVADDNPFTGLGTAGAMLLKNGKKTHWFACDGQMIYDPVAVTVFRPAEFPWQKYTLVAAVLDPEPPEVKATKPAKKEQPDWLKRKVEPLANTPSPFGTEEIAMDESAADLSKKACYLSVTFSLFGDHRKANFDLGTVKTDAQKRVLTFGKHLLECTEYDAIGSADSAFKNKFLSKRALPSPFGNKGIYTMPLNVIEETEQRLRDYYVYRQKTLVPAFLAVYPDVARRMKDLLAEQYDETDYPTPEEMAEEFSMAWKYFQIGTPMKLGEISSELLASEKRKMAADINQTVAEVREALRLQMSELVDHMVDRLSGSDDGRPKVFRNTLTDNIADFLAVFDDRNLASDGDLAKLVERAKNLLKGVDAPTLRDSDSLRAKVAAGFETIKGKLDGMVAAKPSRGYQI